ncbi:MAG: hypothetical protein SGARI_002007 [Bacillariaceae sp.]
MGCLLSTEGGSGSGSTEPPTKEYKSVNTTEAPENMQMRSRESLSKQHAEIFQDEDGETMFFDAMESFSDVVGSTFSKNNMLLEKRIEEMKEESKDDRPKLPKGSRQSVVDITKKLHSGQTIGTHGYPGELNEDELKACLEFRELLKEKDPAYKEMVHAYAPAEAEEFALCRFLRARGFDTQEIFKMLDGNDAVNVWKTARSQDFYKDLGKIYHGCSLPIFMKLFPVCISGLAKNGATMFYFRPGLIDMNALECVCDLPSLVPYLWCMLHAGGTISMQRELEAHGQTKTVLSERIIVVDMKGMSTSLLNTEMMKEAAKITGCFPETMNRSVMMNVPTAFTLVWAVVKLFLDPRTLKKIGFFSWESSAKKDLLQFVDSGELLSDFGGTARSFDETLEKRQAESGECARYIVQCIATGTRNPNFTFDLKKGEKVAAVDVYSKGDTGAKVSVKTKDGKTVVEPTLVKRPDSSADAHYSACLDESKFEPGPGSFVVEADGVAKEHYLVAISVDNV